MPHYYLHIREGGTLNRDEEGQDLPDVEAARREAVSTIREILSEKLLHGGKLNTRTVEIADQTGHVVDVVSTKEVLIKRGEFQAYSDDVTQSAPTNSPRK